MVSAAPRFVTSSDGTRLAVYERGDADGRPTVVAVHGYPDNHTVWDGVAAVLSRHVRVVAYDVRGAGESDKPRGRARYRMRRLLDDLGAVLDAVSPEQPVHLLAHDWGSIQSWPALTDPRLATRIASFTSISGPSLDYSAAWLRQVREHSAATLRQLLHSYYIALFQVPVLPEAIMRTGRIDRLVGLDGQVRRTEADKVNGIELYRANMARRLLRPAPLHTDVPVQVLAPSRDRFVTPRLQVEAPAPYVADLRVRTLEGGHWIVNQAPAVVAAHVREFVEDVSG